MIFDFQPLLGEVVGPGGGDGGLVKGDDGTVGVCHERAGGCQGASPANGGDVFKWRLPFARRRVGTTNTGLNIPGCYGGGAVRVGGDVLVDDGGLDDLVTL